MSVDPGFILREEGLGTHPHWPKGASGVTLPGGYDLGQVDSLTFTRDWAALPQIAIGLLLNVIGVKGGSAGVLLLRNNLDHIAIPEAVALDVFHRIIVPRYFALACKTFPGLENLPDCVQTALTSLCVNRGGIPLHTDIPLDGSSTDSDRYDAERAIHNAVPLGNLPLIEQELRVMGMDGPGSLWPGPQSPNPVLRARRLREAQLLTDWLATKAAA